MSTAKNKRTSENLKANNGLRAVALAVLVMFTLSACVSTSFYTSPTLPEGAENRRNSPPPDWPFPKPIGPRLRTVMSLGH